MDKTVLVIGFTMQVCTLCGEYTNHAFVESNGVVVKVCIPCHDKQVTEREEPFLFKEED